MRTVSALAAGLVFGIGIAISGMADPGKVLNFFDIAGKFDPSLVFVMVSAMLTAMIGYRFVLARQKPLYDEVFHLPPSTNIDRPLMLGAATFGVGWGIAGFCPGGAIPALGLGSAEPLIFVASMEIGMVATRFFRQHRARQRVAA
jgi:uncharacterized membrane protein YedE/YeeE